MSEKMTIARKLCRRYAQALGDRLLVAGVYGSVARGMETKTSDVELVVITADDTDVASRAWLLGELPVEVYVTSWAPLEQLVRTPGPRWAFQMGCLDVLKVLEGDPSLVEKLKHIGQRVPEERFRQALVRQLPRLVWESHGRVHSCVTRDDEGPLHLCVVEVLCEVRDALCLLNRSWVTHDYLEGLRDSFAFQKQPRRWPQLVEALWIAGSSKDVVPLVDELAEAFTALLEDEGITVPRYARVEELPLLR